MDTGADLEQMCGYGADLEQMCGYGADLEQMFGQVSVSPGLDK